MELGPNANSFLQHVAPLSRGDNLRVAKQCYNVQAVVQERVQSTLEFGRVCFVGTLINLLWRSEVGNCIPPQLYTFREQHPLGWGYNMKAGSLV